MISWIYRLFSKKARKQYHHDKIVAEYRRVASSIGDALSYAAYGDPKIKVDKRWYRVHDRELYHVLNELEVAYAELGYSIIPLDRWIDHSGWNVSIDDVWLIKRCKGERPQFTIFEPGALPTVSPLLEVALYTGRPCVMRESNGEFKIEIIDDNGR